MSPAIIAFLEMRQAARLNSHVVDLLSSEISTLRRLAGKLEEASKFNGARVVVLRAKADAIQAELRRVWEIQRNLGALLLGGAWEIDRITTLTERCELLNVNVVDRAALTEEDGIVRIAVAHGLEDSAQRRRMPWNSGPLISAMQSEMNHVMLSTEAGRAAMDKMFAKATGPGGPLEGLTLYDEQPDGTMKRRPPTLTVVDPK